MFRIYYFLKIHKLFILCDSLNLAFYNPTPKAPYQASAFIVLLPFKRFTQVQMSEGNHLDSNKQSRPLKLPQLPPEHRRCVNSTESHPSWSFTETSCSLIHEEGGVTASILNPLIRPRKSDQSDRPFQLEKVLVRTLSMAEMKADASKTTLLSRTMSAGKLNGLAAGLLSCAQHIRFIHCLISAHYIFPDLTKKSIQSAYRRSESLQTLEDSSSSTFPSNVQRSGSMSTATTDSASIHSSVVALVKRRQELEEQMTILQVRLLESFREEWVRRGFIV